MGIELLKGATISRIEGMRRGSDQIMFTTTDGRRFKMHHHQSCCENVELEDVCGDILDLVDYPITVAEERIMQGPASYQSSTWTFYELATVRGSVTLRWLGTSNGYYSESVSFEELDFQDQAQQGELADGVYEVAGEQGTEWWLWDGEHWRDFDGTRLDVWQAGRRFTVLGPVLHRSM